MNLNIDQTTSTSSLRVRRTPLPRIAHEAVRSRQLFTVALSGGSTPKALYKMLLDSDIPVGSQNVFFFGDER